MRANHDAATVEAFLAIGIPMCDAEPVAPVYARICAKLQENAKVYRAIGQNDLWIAANAIHAEKHLVTRNRRHFEAVPELRLLVLAE